MIITIHHMRGLRYCHKGGRLFCKRHNIDWNDFVKNGIDEEILKQTGDDFALKLIEAAHGTK